MEWNQDKTKLKFDFLHHFAGVPSYKKCSAGRNLGGDLSQNLIL